MLDVIEETAEKLFIPLTVGGGISTIDDISQLLNHGADKVSLNSSALKHPAFIQEASEKFGSQCICIAIDSNFDTELNDYFCYTHGGKNVQINVSMTGFKKWRRLALANY